MTFNMRFQSEANDRKNPRKIGRTTKKTLPVVD